MKDEKYRQKEEEEWQLILWLATTVLSGEKAEEAKSLLKTLRFQMGVLEHAEEELKFVQKEIARTKTDIETLMRHK